VTENIFQDGDIDRVLEVLDDKIVRTSEGAFIRVDDLKEFQQQVRDMKAEQELKPKPKTFREARLLAQADPALQTTPPPPRAPALSSVKGVNNPQEA
jgi:hypothetical protein